MLGAATDSPPPAGSQAPLKNLLRWLSYRPFSWLRTRLGDRGSMFLLAVLIGTCGGLGAVGVTYLIRFLQDLAWGSGGTPLEKIARASWWMKLTVPAVGGILVGLIIRFFAHEAKGHGVPEVMYAVARLGGVIRPIVAFAKALATAICIATGGAVGREGPIVQIGSSLGSTFGQMLRLSSSRLRGCVGCGAAAGIAATFNAPIAGAFFAAEIVLGGFSIISFGPLVNSSVLGTVVARSFLGDNPALSIPFYSMVSPAELIPYAVLGLVVAIGGVAFTMLLHYTEEFFDRLKMVPEALQPMIGGLGIGALALAVPQITGTSYETIDAMLHAKTAVAMLLAFYGAKLLASSLTLGSGGSGGVFAPSLFMGAALGGLVGNLAGATMPFSVASPGAYAVVGMGAAVAATTHAPITAILIIFELTGDYRVITALMVSCILAHVFAHWIQRESIYTIKLMRRGIDVREGQEVNLLRRLHVKDVLSPEIELVPRSGKLKEVYDRLVTSSHFEFFTVDREGNLSGVISVDDLRHTLPHLEALQLVSVAEDVATHPVLFLREDDTLDTAMQRFGERTLEELPVLPAGKSMRPVGTVRRQDVINAYNREIIKADLGAGLGARLDAATNLRTVETVGGYVMAHLEVPPRLQGRPLSELRMRQTEGVQIILIDRGDPKGKDPYEAPTSDSVLKPGDRLVVFGTQTDVETLATKPG